MTLNHGAPPLPIDSVDGAVEALRARGHRLSAARHQLLSALFEANEPRTAEDLATTIAERLPGSDLTSVYRNLETLEALGIVRHVHLGHGPGRYALATDRDREFLVCDDCRSVVEVDAHMLDAARDAIREATGFEASFTHFPIAGQCPRCSALGASQRSEHAHP